MGGCGGQWEGDQSEKSYTEDSDAAHDGGVLGRGQGVVGGSEDALGGALAVAGGLDVDLLWGHHIVWVASCGGFSSVVRCGGDDSCR